MTLPTIDQALGPPNVECPECAGTGWTCEQHPGLPWYGEVGDLPYACAPDCAGPGVPCRCRPGVRAAQQSDSSVTLPNGDNT